MKNKDLIEIIRGILDYIERKEENLEYGYSWKQGFIKDLDINDKLKKDLGLQED